MKTANCTDGLTAGEAIVAYRICTRDPDDAGNAKYCEAYVTPPTHVSIEAVADDAFGTFELLREGDIIEVEFSAACTVGQSVRCTASGDGQVAPVAAAFAGYILGECVGAAGASDRRGFVRVNRRVSDATTDITAG